MENLLSYLQHAETKSVRKSLTSSIPFRKLLEDFISKIMSRSCKGLKCSLHKAKTKPCSYTLYEESCFYLTKRWLAVLRVELDWRSPSSLQSCPFHHSPCFRRLTESGTSPLHLSTSTTTPKIICPTLPVLLQQHRSTKGAFVSSLVPHESDCRNQIYCSVKIYLFVVIHFKCTSIH